MIQSFLQQIFDGYVNGHDSDCFYDDFLEKHLGIHLKFKCVPVTFLYFE